MPVSPMAFWDVLIRLAACLRLRRADDRMDSWPNREHEAVCLTTATCPLFPAQWNYAQCCLSCRYSPCTFPTPFLLRPKAKINGYNRVHCPTLESKRRLTWPTALLCPAQIQHYELPCRLEYFLTAFYCRFLWNFFWKQLFHLQFSTHPAPKHIFVLRL